MTRDYLKLGGGGRESRELLDRYGFNLVLCEAGSPLASLLRVHAGWKSIEGDGKTVLCRLVNH